MADYYAPGAWPVWTPGAWLARFIKWATSRCYTQNTKAHGFVVSDVFMFFPYKPKTDNDATGVCPVWTPGAWLTGFIK